MTITEIINQSGGILPDNVRGGVNADFETKPFRDGGYYSCMWEIRDGKRANMKFIAYGDTEKQSQNKLKKIILDDERRTANRGS